MGGLGVNVLLYTLLDTEQEGSGLRNQGGARVGPSELPDRTSHGQKQDGLMEYPLDAFIHAEETSGIFERDLSQIIKPWDHLIMKRRSPIILQ